MPRVLLLFEPPDGGVAENVRQLALGLGEHGFEVELAGPPDALPYAELEVAGLVVHRLPLTRGFGEPASDLKALAGLDRLLRDPRFDLLHAHSAKAGVLGRLVGRRRGVPVVYSPHCFPFVGEHGRARVILTRAVERALGRLSAGILCVCAAERRLAELARVARPQRLHVVLNGADPCPELDPDAELAALRAGGPVVAAITVLRRQKRPDILLEAAPEILRRSPDARVALVGDGPLRRDLERRAAELGLTANDRFSMLSYTGPAARYLSCMDVFVLPSSWEALPIGVLEALACGVPQVVTDVGGNGEAVSSDTGLLVPPGDPDALTKAVVELLEDDRRRLAMADRSRIRHAEKFLTEHMVGGTAAVYRHVLGRERDGR